MDGSKSLIWFGRIRLELAVTTVPRGLKNAANIVVCGYSMPATDGFFRYLYALGTVSDQLLERFWVFDPNLQVEPNFKNLLGPGARARFEFTQEPFEKAVYRLNRDLI